MKLLFSLTSLIFAFLLTSLTARADGYAGLLVGPSFVDQGYGTRFVIGGHIGGKLTQNFSLGFYGTYQNMGTGTIDPGPGAFTSNVKETILAAEANYYPVDQLPFYFGAKLGLAISSYSSTGGDSVTSTQTGADIAVGPAVGIDFPIAQNLSAGGEFNTIFIVSNAETIHLINLLGTVTFHF